MFWIDYPSVIGMFRGLYMNWNRELFAHRTSVHRSWPINAPGPKVRLFGTGRRIGLDWIELN